VDRAGEIIAQLNGYECVSDPSLNQAFRKNQLLPEPTPSV